MKRPVILRLFALAIFASSTLLSTICAQEKETRNIPNVSSVSVGSGIDLYLTQGDAVSLEIEADKSQLHKIITEVKGTELRIYTKDRWNWKSMKAPKVYLTMQQVEKIVSSGGADVYTQNTIRSERLKVVASGGADAYITVDVKELVLDSSGGSDIKAEGKAEKLTANASGGSDIMAGDLAARFVKVNASGGADATVHATDEIYANASGGSDINYSGNATIKESVESGGGDINRK